MSSKLHLFLIFKFILEILIAFEIDQLSALEHTVRKCLVISTSDHVHLWVDISTLDHLEVMREIASEINLFVAQGF